MEKRLDISASQAPFCFGENLFLCEPVVCVRLFTPNKLLFSTADVSVRCVCGPWGVYCLPVKSLHFPAFLHWQAEEMTWMTPRLLLRVWKQSACTNGGDSTECEMSLPGSVIYQAEWWRHHAVPRRPGSSGAAMPWSVKDR